MATSAVNLVVRRPWRLDGEAFTDSSYLKRPAQMLFVEITLQRQFVEVPGALEEELTFRLKPVVHVRAARAAAIQINGVGPFRDVLVGWTPAIAGCLSP
jgi:hypothetical protein